MTTFKKWQFQASLNWLVLGIDASFLCLDEGKGRLVF